jgi:hypothetical protein
MHVFKIDMQHGHATWTCRVDMQRVRAACTCSKGMQQRHVTCMEIQRVHLVRSFNKGIQHGDAASTCSNAAWACNMDSIDMQHEHKALTA